MASSTRRRVQIIAAASTFLVPASIYGGVYLRNLFKEEDASVNSQVDEFKQLVPNHEDTSVLLMNTAGEKGLADDPITLKQKSEALAAHRNIVAQKIRDAEERLARNR